jgi:septin 7
VAAFKSVIMEQIVAAKIKIYEFPEVEDGEEVERKENRRMKERVPFAVVGSNTILEGEDGKRVRGRRYPWGVVDIENLNHCDFLPLRNMLIKVMDTVPFPVNNLILLVFRPT